MENELSYLVNALPELVRTALSDWNIDFPNERRCEYTGLSLGLLSTPKLLKGATAQMGVRT